MSYAAPVITAWSAVSGFGVGRAAFADGMRDRELRPAPLDPGVWQAPVKEACLVPAFDPRQLLGRKGTRAMDRATALAVVAIRHLLDDGTGQRLAGIGDDTGLVLGTSTGSVSSIMSFTRDSLTQDKPYHVDPERFPNTVMNCAAGQSAIWHRLRGPNVTVACGATAGLHALKYAWRLHRTGRAPSVIFGGVEEFSAERSWLEWHARRQEPPRPVMGEGCAVLLLESPSASSRTAAAEVSAVEFGLARDEHDATDALAGCIRRAMSRAGVQAADLWAVVLSAEAPDRERQALADVLGTPAPPCLPCSELIGDTHAASGAFQLVTLLAAVEREPECAGRSALVTSIDRDGVVGCALLRLRPGARA